jgi:hypothetical protein
LPRRVAAGQYPLSFLMMMIAFGILLVLFTLAIGVFSLGQYTLFRTVYTGGAPLLLILSVIQAFRGRPRVS